jgi:sensor domain CHASE-containing protein
MIDGNILITIVPPIVTALIAYGMALVKSRSHERIQRAKIEAEVDNKAMEMVRSVMEELRQELKAEINLLREENKMLRKEANTNREEIERLRQRLRDSDILQDSMKSEIVSLQKTIQWYEQKFRDAGGVPPVITKT